MLDTSEPEIARAACASDEPARPALTSGVDLLGEMPGTSFQDRQWLATRNGQFIQLTELLYRICEQCTGTRSLDQIAAAVTNSTEWSVDAEQIALIIQNKLVPIGLVCTTPGDAALPEQPASSPAGLRLRLKAVGPDAIDPVTSVLKVLFTPVLMLPILAAIIGAHAWLYFGHGMSASLTQILSTPGLLLVIVPILLVGLGFHELGHASALSHGGGRVRGMGVGLYLVFPAFYTDTTEAYRLGRWARVRTDLGGFYFHLIFALALVGLYLATGLEFLLIPVLLIDLDVVYQCLPFIRLDGYWALADVTGIPDFWSQMAPFVASLSPRRRPEATKLPPLRPFARMVFVLYILLVLPVLAVVAVLTMSRLPWFLATMWDSATQQQQAFARASGSGDGIGAAVAAVQLLLLALPTLGTLYFVGSLVWPAIKAARRLALRRQTTVVGHNEERRGAPVRGWLARLAVWCAWVVATTIGWLAGSAAVLAVLAWTTGVTDTIVRSGAGSAILGAIMGLAIGVGEWIVLRRALRAGKVWIAVTVATWAMAWAIGQAISDGLLDEYWFLGLVPGGLLVAAMVGVGQWLVLRRYARRASWWLPASLVGWSGVGIVSMYGGAGLFAMGLAAFIGPVGWLIAAAPGAFAGLITGAVLTAWGRAATR